MVPLTKKTGPPEHLLAGALQRTLPTPRDAGSPEGEGEGGPFM